MIERKSERKSTCSRPVFSHMVDTSSMWLVQSAEIINYIPAFEDLVQNKEYRIVQ